jgi:hypothetical protein
MSDRIDELVAAIDANTLLQWDGKDVALVAAHDLATIAREAEANAKGQEANAVFALQLKRDAEAEADKWRKVAEWLANQLVTAKVRWPVLVGAWSLPPRAEDVWIEAALAAVEQEEAE